MKLNGWQNRNLNYIIQNWKEWCEINTLALVDFDGVKTVDSRDVAVAIEKEHKHLMRDIRTYCEYLTQSKIGLNDFFIESNYTDSIGRTLPRYLITRKGCEMIANKMTGQKGVAFTALYIHAFHEMEQQLTEIRDSYMISDPIERAKRWIEEEQNRVALKAANDTLSAKIEEDKPKVLFADSVTASQTSILVGELAKLIKQNGVEIGQQRMFTWLRNNGFLIKRKGSDYNMPTQYSMELGLFEIKETSITHADGHVSVNKTPKVTGKGQQFFINKFLNN